LQTPLILHSNLGAECIKAQKKAEPKLIDPAFNFTAILVLL